jgi:hypothetical protein
MFNGIVFANAIATIFAATYGDFPQSSIQRASYAF